MTSEVQLRRGEDGEKVEEEETICTPGECAKLQTAVETHRDQQTKRG